MEPERNIDLIKYVNWINEGKSFSDVREDLMANHIPDDSIRKLIVEIDNKLIEQAMSADQGFSAQKSDMIGKLLAGVGGVVLVVYFFVRSYTVLGIGGALLSAGVTLILFGRKLAKGNGSVFEKSNKRKLNLRKGRE